MSILQENIMKKIEEKKEKIQEGMLTKGKFHVWYEEVPEMMKALTQLNNLAKKYISQVKKDYKSGKFPDMDYPYNMALEVSMYSQPVLGTHMFKKDKRNKTWLKLVLRDGNMVGPHLLKKEESTGITCIVGEANINTKLELQPKYVK